MNYFMRLFKPSEGAYFIPLTIMRAAFGLFFFTAGFNKVFIPENQRMMLETITEAGIPFPSTMAVVVAVLELVCGLLVAIGLLTRMSALVLMIISGVALLTIGIHGIPAGVNLLTWYSWLLYLPEPNYILICIVLLVQGCGPWGVDNCIYQYMKSLNRSVTFPYLL